MMRNRYIVVNIFLLIILAQPGFAQVNTEKFRRADMTPGLSGYLQLDTDIRRGNVEKTELEYESRHDVLRDNSYAFLYAAGEYGWQGGSPYSDAALVHLRYMWRPQSSIQPEIYTQINYDRERLIEFRGLAGAGVRVRILHQTGARFWYGTSLMAEHERLDVPADGNHDDEYTVGRWSNYLATGGTLSKLSGWNATTYIQPRIDDFSDLRLLAETGLTVTVTEHVALSVDIRLNYDSEPPGGVEKLDSALKTGIVFEY